MKIECPICSMEIEIEAAHIGRKGRCERCESKFIIPENPDDEFEILHRGEVPDDEVEGKDIDEEKPKRDRPRVVPASGNARRRRPAAKLIITKTGPSTGTMVAFTAACIALAVGIAVALSSRSEPDTTPTDRIDLITGGDVAPPSEPVAPASPTPGKAAPELPEEEPEIAAADAPETPAVAEPAAVEEAPPALTEEQKASALTFLKSNLEKKRKNAYAGFRKLGDRERSSYRDLLNQARDHHRDGLGERILQISTGDNALSKSSADFAAWTDARKTAKKMVQTNWKDSDPGDYKKKHAEMDEAFEEAEKAYTRAIRSAERAEDFEPSGLQEFAAALAEIRVELAWCDGEEWLPEVPDVQKELSQVGSAGDYLMALERRREALKVAATLEAADDHNAGCDWADGAYQTFAENLNERRVALGLKPLRLEELLSKACADHSEDMATHGYFSHSGRTEETKSFGKRAKRAGFSGFATGECIFMGSPSPMAAHQAWWYSDGHRLIMYANNPNTLGLGLHGKHWTLNTGKM